MRAEALAILSSSKRIRFLVALAAGIPFAARGQYVEMGHDEAHAVRALRHVNEMMIVATKQLQSSMAQKPAYPDEAFLKALAEHATMGQCREVLGSALSEAIKASAAP
jgi:hypothetical protein